MFPFAPILALLPFLVFHVQTHFIASRPAPPPPDRSPPSSSLTQLDILFPQPFESYDLPVGPATHFPIAFAIHDIAPFLPYSPAFEWNLFSRSNLTHEIDSGGLPFSPEEGLNLEFLAGDDAAKEQEPDEKGSNENGSDADEEEHEDKESSTKRRTTNPNTFLLINGTDCLQNGTGTKFLLHYHLHFHNCYRMSEPEFGKESVSGFVEFDVVRPDDDDDDDPLTIDTPSAARSVPTPDSDSEGKEKEEDGGEGREEEKVHPIDLIPRTCSHVLGTIGMLGSGPTVMIKIADEVRFQLVAVVETKRKLKGGNDGINVDGDQDKDGEDQESLAVGEKMAVKSLGCWGWVLVAGLMALV
ncbi:hypothetical protein MKZ38_002488 [Zalerion maritima]|uniref:Uncharacterized protein n=1 Tax=Zalerion maritima TaxID=339359 RepID=A0AAD5RNX4_9PEZI|nr:hypothetical protein MKZ38_002488 [Zalerion maritima]